MNDRNSFWGGHWALLAFLLVILLALLWALFDAVFNPASATTFHEHRATCHSAASSDPGRDTHGSHARAPRADLSPTGRGAHPSIERHPSGYGLTPAHGLLRDSIVDGEPPARAWRSTLHTLK